MASVVPSPSTPTPFPSARPPPPPNGWGGAFENDRGRRTRLLVVVAVVTIFLTATVLLVLFEVPWVGTGPNGFAPDGGPSRVPAGSVGCRDLTANVRYSVSFITLYTGIPFSNLFFAVSNGSSVGTSVSSNVPLGPGANVSVLNSTMSVLGVWNFSSGHWSSPPSGDLPYNIPVSIVLDTGLDSNATFAGSYFYVEHSVPSQGSVGFPIGWW